MTSSSSSSSFPPSSQSPPQTPSNDLLLAAIMDPSRRPVTWEQLWTGEGLPDSDRQIVLNCKRLVVRRAVMGAALAGGLVGGIVYGRGLLTSQRRFIITTASTLWGVGVGAMSASPVCMKRATQSKDPDSVLRKEMARIAVQHNPNRAMEHVARERIAQLHHAQEEQKRLGAEHLELEIDDRDGQRHT